MYRSVVRRPVQLIQSHVNFSALVTCTA